MSTLKSEILETSNSDFLVTEPANTEPGIVKLKQDFHYVGGVLKFEIGPSAFTESIQEVYETISHKEVFLNEGWEEQYDVYSKVFAIDADTVYCECLVDEDESIIEEMTFPLSFLKNIPNLKEGKLLLIKVSKKAGTIKHEILNGEGFHKAKEFFEVPKLISDFDNYPKSELL